MTAHVVVLTIVNVRPSLFTLVMADLALLFVAVAALGLRHRMKRRRKDSADDPIPCGECHRLIPPDKFNCIFCGWPHVPEKDEESETGRDSG